MHFDLARFEKGEKKGEKKGELRLIYRQFCMNRVEGDPAGG